MHSTRYRGFSAYSRGITVVASPPFVGDDVVAKGISNFKKQSCITTQKGANLGLKCVRMRLAAGLRPDPLGGA